MTKEEWKKNDALMKAALRKMGIFFWRDPDTWEAHACTSKSKRYVYICVDLDDIVIDGPSTPSSSGDIATFEGWDFATDTRCISNIFFGVKSYEELQIRLDLMT